MKPYQRINHFPGMYTMSRKSNLANNLKNMKIKFPKEYNFFPKTWLLPSESGRLTEYYRVSYFYSFYKYF